MKASQIDPPGDEGGRSLLTASCLRLDRKTLPKNLKHTFGTKSEVVVARAKVSALSGAARGEEFQPGEKELL